MSGWVYAFGERTGRDIKLGWTDQAVIASRRVKVDRDQMNEDAYVLLAAVRGNTTAERALQRYFDDELLPKGRHREYFRPSDRLRDYILWLRQQWYTVHDEGAKPDDTDERHPSEWEPRPDRRVPPPPRDPAKLLQDWDVDQGPLFGTAWAFMPNLRHSFQDYFTPDDLVRRAERAMGTIDLDAASHFLANRKFWKAGIRIGDFYHVNRSAFDHDWTGNVWLNPPYGEYGKWLDRAEDMLEAGLMEQLCMLSPGWAFITKTAQSMVRRSSASVLLSPTPAFEVPNRPLAGGSNLPHMIFYWGRRADDFLAAFTEGSEHIPLRIDFRTIAEVVA